MPIVRHNRARGRLESSSRPLPLHGVPPPHEGAGARGRPHRAAAHGHQAPRDVRRPLALGALRAHPRAEQHGHRDHRSHGARGARRRASARRGSARRPHPPDRQGADASRGRSRSSRWRSSASALDEPDARRGAGAAAHPAPKRAAARRKRSCDASSRQDGSRGHEPENRQRAGTRDPDSASSPARSPACSRTASSARTFPTRRSRSPRRRSAPTTPAPRASTSTRATTTARRRSRPATFAKIKEEIAEALPDHPELLDGHDPRRRDRAVRRTSARAARRSPPSTWAR